MTDETISTGAATGADGKTVATATTEAGRSNANQSQCVRNFYQTEAYGTTCIVLAATPGKARYATFRAMRDAGYRVDLCGVRISVRRRRDMDGSMTKTGGIPVEGKCLAPELFANSIVLPTSASGTAEQGDTPQP